MTVTEQLASLETSPEWEDIEFPPGDLESQELPLESYLHLQQILLLIKCLDWLWRDRNDYFDAGNLTIYYSPHQKKSSDFRGPDFFVVLDTERRSRKSWVVWEEGGKYPNIIVELLSSSTAKTDRTEKKKIYQDIFRTPEYFWFDPESLEFQGFALIQGTYQPITPTDKGHLWSEQLQLFLGVENRQLRFFSPDGVLVPTPEESATKSQNELVNTQNQLGSIQNELVNTQNQLQIERKQKDQLAAKLRELGIDPEQL
ncbi:Uma2 family endonuclease [Limnospira platensis CENA597]|uniref:Uma2 family endonuclease n=1 Tax=Limnospira platensis TaxID=118562 RepID=UPI003DA177CA